MIAELIERLEKAEGPDREIDADILLALDQQPNEHYKEPWRRPILLSREQQRPGLLEYVEISGVSARAAPAYTASLDAALSLVERKLPGVHWSVSNAAVKPRANVWMPQPTRPIMGPYSSGATPALAVCLALLRALSTEA